MTYDEFIKCKSILNETNHKLSKIESYGFNTNDLKILRDKLNNEINNSHENTNVPSFTNNINSHNKQFLKKEKTNNSKLLESVIEYDKTINKYLKSFKIIDEYKLIEKEITDDISINKLNNLIDQLFILISNYKDLKDTGYENIHEKEIYALLYKIIKVEFRLKDSSSLFKFLLLNYNYIYSDLLELANQDIEKYMNNRDIYKRFNEIISYKELDENMVYLLSMNENNYKEKVFNEFEENENNLSKAKQEYENLKNSKNKKSVYENEAKKIKKNMNKAIIINSLCKIMAVLALFGIIKGSKSLKENSNYHSTTMEVYDTLLPDTDYIEDYTDYSENQVVVFDYKIPTEDNFMDANIKVNQYNFDYDGRDLEDYANLDFDNLTPTKSKLNINLSRNKTEHTVVKLVKNINYDDKYSSTGDYIENIGLSMLIPVEILLAVFTTIFDFKFLDDKRYYLTPSALSILTIYPYINIKLIIEDLKDINKLLEKRENGITYNKENLKLLKNKLTELEKQYNELLDRYPNIEVLASYNDKKLELK